MCASGDCRRFAPSVWRSHDISSDLCVSASACVCVCVRGSQCDKLPCAARYPPLRALPAADGAAGRRHGCRARPRGGGDEEILRPEVRRLCRRHAATVVPRICAVDSCRDVLQLCTCSRQQRVEAQQTCRGIRGRFTSRICRKSLSFIESLGGGPRPSSMSAAVCDLTGHKTRRRPVFVVELQEVFIRD